MAPPAFPSREFVMGILLSTLGIWLAFNLVIIAAMHLKPLRDERRGIPPLLTHLEPQTGSKL